MGGRVPRAPPAGLASTQCGGQRRLKAEREGSSQQGRTTSFGTWTQKSPVSLQPSMTCTRFSCGQIRSGATQGRGFWETQYRPLVVVVVEVCSQVLSGAWGLSEGDAVLGPLSAANCLCAVGPQWAGGLASWGNGRPCLDGEWGVGLPEGWGTLPSSVRAGQVTLCEVWRVGGPDSQRPSAREPCFMNKRPRTKMPFQSFILFLSFYIYF